MVVTRSSTLTLGGGMPIGYKGVIDCSLSPNYPAAAAGDMYLVSVAGKIGGGSGTVVAVGDAVIANATNVGGTEAAVGAYWDILETNVDWSSVTITGGTINGATIGATSPSTIVSTTTQVNTGLTCDANDGAYLGTATNSFSDLFLAEGGVINWDNGDVTLTQTDNTLTVAGGTFQATAPIFTTNLTVPYVQTAENASSYYTNIPVSGTDATLHTSSHLIDGKSYLYATATGDGAGDIGAMTINLGTGTDADTINIGDANAIVNITDAHWSMTEAGVLSFVSMGSSWTNAGRTVADGGIFTTLDLNGGTIDATTIGGATKAAGTFTSLTADTIAGPDNAVSLPLSIASTGADVATHTVSMGIDGNIGISVAATGNGAGAVGVHTINVGVSGNADVVHIGDANALVDITDAHWSITEAGAASFTGINSATSNQVIGVTNAGTGIEGKTVTAGVGISVTHGANAITVAATGSGMAWSEVTGTTQAMAIATGYIANNGALVTLTLPASAAVGSVMQIVGKGTGLWKIAQNASQTIHFGNQNTTTGVGGSLAAVAQYDTVEIVCITADLDFVVTSAVGNLTVV